MVIANKRMIERNKLIDALTSEWARAIMVENNRERSNFMMMVLMDAMLLLWRRWLAMMTTGGLRWLSSKNQNL
jgi:hypothetical protein